MQIFLPPMDRPPPLGAPPILPGSAWGGLRLDEPYWDARSSCVMRVLLEQGLSMDRNSSAGGYEGWRRRGQARGRHSGKE